MLLNQDLAWGTITERYPHISEDELQVIFDLLFGWEDDRKDDKMVEEVETYLREKGQI